MADSQRHPFLHGLSKHRGAPPTVVVIFGASGDLTARKLIPAVYNLGVDNLLPADFFLVGYGRTEIPDDEFRTVAVDAIKKFSRRELDADVWKRIAPNTSYVAGAYDDKAAFDRLAQHIDAIEKKLGRDIQPLFYISTPPSVFAPILRNLGASGLAARHLGQPTHSKVIIEKPFGHDLKSAQELNQTIQAVFEERQVYRIDHYLGKETVQDLLVQRFANSIFEPLWNRNFVDHVQITVAEEVGVGTRGGYYEQSGCLRDMIQNHTMQLVALTAMEPPGSLDAEAIRDEKVKLLRAIRPLDQEAEIAAGAVRGQYTRGGTRADLMSGYREEPGVDPLSSTETFVAMRLEVGNWRWNGVPVYVRTGKRLPARLTEVAMQFHRPPQLPLFPGTAEGLEPDALIVRVQPDEGLSLRFGAKVPGHTFRVQKASMDFSYESFEEQSPDAYERVILDALIGDPTLFIRADEVGRSWRIVDPVMHYWSGDRRPIPLYQAAT